MCNGRAIAQAVSRWLPTAAARVHARVWSSGICVDKMALWQVFSEYFGFPCQFSFHQLLHNLHHLGLYNRPEVAAVPGDVSPTPPKKKKPLCDIKIEEMS
jgi:hypothetical protein